MAMDMDEFEYWLGQLTTYLQRQKEAVDNAG